MKTSGKKVYVARVQGGYGITTTLVFMRNPTMRDIQTALDKELDGSAVLPAHAFNTAAWQEAFEIGYKCSYDYDEELAPSDDCYVGFELESCFIHVCWYNILDNRADI